MDESNIKSFKWQICGHENIVHFLQSAISGDHISHAYLFSGPANLGKETVAKEFIASLLCSSENKPCHACANCRQFKNGLYPDFYLIERTINEKTEKLRSEIVIEQIRELRGKLQQGTLLSGYKIALIKDAHLLNPNSANALLKILEEPTKKTVIILLVDDTSLLPETIASRCQILKFLPVGSQTMTEYLNKIKIGDNSELAKLAHGRPGLAISFLQDESRLKEIDGDIGLFLKTVATEIGNRYPLLETINWDKDETVNYFKLNSILSHWQSAIRDILLIKNGQNDLVANSKNLSQMEKIALDFDFFKLQNMLKNISQAENYLWKNIGSKSTLENLIINL